MYSSCIDRFTVISAGVASLFIENTHAIPCHALRRRGLLDPFRRVSTITRIFPSYISVRHSIRFATSATHRSRHTTDLTFRYRYLSSNRRRNSQNHGGKVAEGTHEYKKADRERHSTKHFHTSWINHLVRRYHCTTADTLQWFLCQWHQSDGRPCPLFKFHRN